MVNGDVVKMMKLTDRYMQNMVKMNETNQNNQIFSRAQVSL